MYFYAIKAGILVLSFAAFWYTIYKSKSKERALSNRPQTNNFGNFSGGSISSCSVCLTEFNKSSNQEVLTLPCAHKFHKICIFLVFENEATNRKLCPLCRRAVSEVFIKDFIK